MLARHIPVYATWIRPFWPEKEAGGFNLHGHKWPVREFVRKLQACSSLSSKLHGRYHRLSPACYCTCSNSYAVGSAGTCLYIAIEINARPTPPATPSAAAQLQACCWLGLMFFVWLTCVARTIRYANGQAWPRLVRPCTNHQAGQVIAHPAGRKKKQLIILHCVAHYFPCLYLQVTAKPLLIAKERTMLSSPFFGFSSPFFREI